MHRFLILSIVFFQTVLSHGQHRFIENKGQWPAGVFYKTDISGGSFYLESNRLVFDRYDTEVASKVFAAHRGETPIPPPNSLDCHAYAMEFLGAGGGSPFGKKTYETEYAYFIRGRSGQNARAFEEVIYENLYEGIDLKVHSKANLKYDFIVKTGADPSQIQISYDGIKPRLKSEGHLELNTSVGKVTESEPFAYQIIDQQIERVECAYAVNGNTVSFELGPYDERVDLIIDPELIFSTYSGSTADNFGYSATFDQDGHLYSGSTAFGTGYPVTMGAYQATWGGGTGAETLVGTDIAISKYSLDGTDLIYSTYLGGGGDELPHSLVTDSLGRLFLLGTTGSDDYPTSSGAYQTVFNGGAPTLLGGIGVNFDQGSDIVVSALSANGQNLIGSTLIGGNENDGTNTSAALKYNYADEVRGEIELDNEGNILIGSCTFSSDFPVSDNAVQPSIGGSQDGVFFLLNPSMTNLLASTFVGGEDDDAVYSISFSSEIGVTLGGGTESGDIAVPVNAYQADFSGGQADGFVLTLDELATEIISGTYFGTGAYDQAYFVDRDAEGGVYLYGQTESAGSELLFNAEYGQEGRGMFVSKLGENLESADFSTTFGNEEGIPPLSPVAFAVDLCNRVYLSGWGGTTNTQGTTVDLEVTEDAFQDETDGNDFYFLVLEDNANALTFASFYGGDTSAEHVDGGTSRFDRSGKIYQAACAGCGGNSDFPIEPPNALSPLNNSPNCNLGVAKIDFDLPLILADFEAEDVCLPTLVEFINTSESFTGATPNYTWLFPNGDEIFAENTSYFFDTPGSYEIQLVATEVSACNQSDTITKVINVFSELELEVPEEFISCDEDTFTIEALTNGSASLFTWALDENLSDVVLQGETDSILAFSPEGPLTLYLEVDNGLCTEIREIFLAPAVEVNLNLSDTLLCNLDEFQITAFTNYPQGNFIWAPNDLIIDGQGSLSPNFSAGESFDAAVTVTNQFGCSDSADVSIASFDIVLSVTDDTLACFNEDLVLTANSFGTAESFIWSSSPDFGNVLNPTGDSTITVTPGAVQFYYTLVENNGCTLTDTVAVSQLEAGTSVSAVQYICAGDTARIFVSNDFPGGQLVHEWEPQELIISGNGTFMIQAIINEPTTFTVNSSTEFGCSVENSITVSTSPLGNGAIVAQANPGAVIEGESSQLSVMPVLDGVIYQWQPPTYLDNPGLTDPVSTPQETITYIVTLTDANDNGVCQKSDTVIVQVFDSFCGSPNIFVPNAFTPNGDGENDEVLVRGGGITDLSFAIFNRWGEEVFATEDQSAGWDGTYKGNLAEPAVFVYQLEAVCDDGETYFEKGNITLIR